MEKSKFNALWKAGANMTREELDSFVKATYDTKSIVRIITVLQDCGVKIVYDCEGGFDLYSGNVKRSWVTRRKIENFFWSALENGTAETMKDAENVILIVAYFNSIELGLNGSGKVSALGAEFQD